jgi:diaminopimelate decarboxylase/aspartate kinase
LSERWTVLKFGGTSVAAASQWATIADLAGQSSRAGNRVVLVCSALAGVTNALEAIANGLAEPVKGVDSIIRQHAVLAAELGLDADDLLEEGERRINVAVAGVKTHVHPAEMAELLGCGEWLSSRLGCLYLAEHLDIEWVDARKVLRALDEPDGDSKRDWLSARCAAVADVEMASDWSAKSQVLITQGFVASAQGGRTVLLGRGGSDTSAALLAARLQAESVQIWTDVPGLFSTDPRDEPAALLIRTLDYAEALELAASGARVVHPRCIRAAFEAGIPVLIRDLGQPQLKGTRISGQDPRSGEGIKAVTCQDGMLVLLLENLDTRQQVGFLARVFQVISEQGVSVDLVATSETTTTVAIDMAVNHLDPAAVSLLAELLGAHCRVQVFEDCSCVNLVGRGARTALMKLGPAAGAFSEIPLLMLSQSANDLSISLLVRSEHAGALAHALHKSLVEEELDSRRWFGPSWQDLKAG